ncbi:hypothetical protein [Rhizobium leguminosarum]|uniref:hypothetical protein n=1 Tax=Rhizobium leguminosarum TaxID=384 RepID=UPI001442591F|nr:hypothetical protein [Rhizobium leguminosarum]
MYEQATNRIRASVLYRIGDCLGVPVAWFFEGLPLQGDAAGGDVADIRPWA